MSTHTDLREHLCWLVTEGHAHPGFERVFSDIPRRDRGRIVDAVPHSLWQLLDHVRICQRDLLDYSRDPGHRSPDFPAGYWPPRAAVPSDDAWSETYDQVLADREEFCRLIRQGDPLAPFEWAPDHTLLRSATILADHNAYHFGQAVLLRKHLGCWEPEG